MQDGDRSLILIYLDGHCREERSQELALLTHAAGCAFYLAS